MPKPKVTAVVDRDARIERRLTGDSRGGSLSLEIPSKEKDRHGKSLYVFRIVNAEVGDDHLWRTKEKGWDFAEEADIDGRPEDYGGFELWHGRLVRGVRGTQVLMKMRKRDYDDIQKAKSAQNRKQTFGSKQMKQEIVSKASGELGDEGADFLNRSLGNIEITDRMERIPVDEQ